VARIVSVFSVGIILTFRRRGRMHAGLFWREIPMLFPISWKLLVGNSPVISLIKEDVIVRRLIASKSIVSAFMPVLSVLIYVSAKIV
jgi:hypothetical protein